MEHKINEQDVRDAAIGYTILPEGMKGSIDPTAVTYIINLHGILVAQMEKLLAPISDPSDFKTLVIEEGERTDADKAFTEKLDMLLEKLDETSEASSPSESVSSLLQERVFEVTQANPDGYATMSKNEVLTLFYDAVLHVILNVITESTYRHARAEGLQEVMTITSFDVSRGLAEHIGFANLFKDALPPPPLCGITSPEDNDTITLAMVEKDLRGAFPKVRFEKGAVESCHQSVVHLINLFEYKEDAFKAWLDSLPIKDESPDLKVQCYRKVMGLIIGGIQAQPAFESLSYNLVVYAILQNPYYDLSAYLRADEVE
ncbi:Hypothetical protein POVN_LOCUS286 [uncultured virus]|nr:Hypothetical protein POVN_LOCUS286 [uncultured virus]